MFDVLWVFLGFLAGMIVTTVFIPPRMKKKLVPDVKNPRLILRNPEVENGCFRARASEVSCTAEHDFLNR
jgi:hypothetical protein